MKCMWAIPVGISIFGYILPALRKVRLASFVRRVPFSNPWPASGSGKKEADSDHKESSRPNGNEAETVASLPGV